MKVELNFGILMIIGICITMVLISVPDTINSFAFGFFNGILATVGIYLLRKKIIYDTKKKKFQNPKKNKHLNSSHE
jgi:Ni/Fe-hydrogenase subunit HybB-like protein